MTAENDHWYYCIHIWNYGILNKILTLSLVRFCSWLTKEEQLKRGLFVYVQGSDL